MPIYLVGQFSVGIPILILPWLFGGVFASSQVWLAIGLILSLSCSLWICLSAKPSDTEPLSAATFPLLIAILLGLMQLVPLPPSVARAMAPGNVDLRSFLEPAPMTNESTSIVELQPLPTSESRPISLYPASTKKDLVLLCLAVGVFFVGSRLFSNSAAMLVFMGIAAANGAALAFFGIAQQLNWKGLLYGAIPITRGSPFASFVSRTHAGGYLNIALGVAIGFVLWTFARRSSNPDPGEIEVAVLKRDSMSSAWVIRIQEACIRLQVFVAHLTGWKLLSFVTVMLVFAGVLCSMSRGAWLAAIGAAITSTIAIYAAKRSALRAVIFVLAALLATALVGWLGRTDLIVARFDTLAHQATSPDGRLSHWRDGLSAAADFFPAGSGLGTYRFVYPLAQREANSTQYYHAENQYLEALAEAGLLGVVLLAGMIVVVAAACRRLLNEPVETSTFAFGVAGVFCLTSQGIHSFFDFGLYLPANMALFALVCGALCGRAAQLQPLSLRRKVKVATQDMQWRARFREIIDHFVFGLKKLRFTRSLPATVATILLIAAIYGFVQTSYASSIESEMREQPVEQTLVQRPLSEITSDITRLEGVLYLQPRDAEVHLRLALLWIARYRARIAESSSENQTPEYQKKLWDRAAPMELHKQAWTLRQQNRKVELDDLRLLQPVQIDLANAARHLVLARAACPLLPQPHLLLAELTPLIPTLGDETLHLSRMRKLANSDPDLLKESSLVELQAGRIDQALNDWSRLVELSPDRLPHLVTFTAKELGMIDKIDRLLPRDPRIIIDLAQDYFSDPNDEKIRNKLLNRATDLLVSPDIGDGERNYIQGIIFSLRNDEKAIEYMAKAVEICPENAQWRYRLAVLLQKAGKLDAAHEHAVLCVRSDPQNEAYGRLLKELIHLRLTAT